MWFLHPLPKVKVIWQLFALFSKNYNFFRPKKGPRTGLSQSLTRLTAIQFSDHAKSMAQITERIFNEAPPRCRSQKSIIFRTKPKEKCTSVFLHCRMDRALRAKNKVLEKVQKVVMWLLPLVKGAKIALFLNWRWWRHEEKRAQKWLFGCDSEGIHENTDWNESPLDTGLELIQTDIICSTDPCFAPLPRTVYLVTPPN